MYLGSRSRGMSRFKASGSPLDADAAAWAAAVTANSGTYTAAHLAALNTAITSRKAAGLWTKKALWGPLCGSNLAAALVQWRNGAWEVATSVNFVNGDYTATTGLTGNGGGGAATKYLRSGLIASTLSTNDTHLAVYNRAGGAAAMATVGAWSNSSGTNALSILAPLSDGNFYSDQYNATTARVSAAVSASYGLMVGTRTAANAHAIYEQGALLATSAVSAGALPALEVYVFTLNENGAPKTAGWSAGPIASYSAGSGLSAAEVTSENTIEQAYQLAMGRNV